MKTLCSPAGGDIRHTYQRVPSINKLYDLWAAVITYFKIIGCFVDDLTDHLSYKVAENGQKKRPKIQSDNDQPSNTQRNSD